MFRYAFLLFVAYLICEILVTSYFYANFPPVAISFFIVFMMFLGIFMLKRSQFFLAASMKTSFFSQFDLRGIVKQNILYALSAILFIIPGILSDFMGAVLILFVLYLQLNGKISKNKNEYNFKGEEDVIDAEIVDNSSYIDIDDIYRRM
ncbi:MAG: hypothetical protein KN64_12560 [Sulfurovum sp. AS07-7]|nr:MAG: hypothetical protein KN64_12560 [Sulfurovum sp. AS07-7]